MPFNPYDFLKLKQLLDNNKGMLESFFGNNPFGDDFMKNMSNSLDGQIPNKQPESEEAHINSGERQDNPVSRTIPMDMIQRKNELLLIFEIPGISGQDDVNIKILGSTLVLEGDISRNYLLNGKETTNFERKVGHFSKKVNLPIIYDSKRIRARYNKGLLEIRIPVLRQNNQEKISIQFPQSES